MEYSILLVFLLNINMGYLTIGTRIFHGDSMGNTVGFFEHRAPLIPIKKNGLSPFFLLI